MIIVRLKGGLGNQMFQYALGRVLALKNNDVLKVDVNFYKSKNTKLQRVYNLDVFNMKAEIMERSWGNLFLRLTGKVKERSFSFDPRVLSLSSGVYLDGYWQSPKYFEGFEDVIKKDFSLKNIQPQNIQNLLKEIEKTDSLSIHVRRGDYVGNTFHEVVNLEYYRKGVEYISKKTKIEKIYVFSDDIIWCKNNLKFEFPTMFVDDSYASEKGEGHMYLMSLCKNFIIANSTFSWWGAWLSDYKNKIVVCPKQWFGDVSINSNDLIPENWVRI